MKTQSSLAKTTLLKAVDGRLSTLCAFVLPLLVLALPVAVKAQDYTYTTNNGTITITGYTGSSGAAIIPDSIKGLPVTSIGERAFDSRSSLITVTIPESVLSIESGAFWECTNLRSVTIPNSVSSIGNGAFYACSSLTNVAISDSVTNIGVIAFGYCASLTAITVNTLNSVYSSAAGVLFNKSQTTLIQHPGGKAGSYTIPVSVTSIGDRAFDSCYGLTTVTIPNSVTSIGYSTFWECTNLSSVTIGNSVTTISQDAFGFCASLTNVAIGDSVTSIGNGAFWICTGLTRVSIPNSVTSIGIGAFFGCTRLTGVYFKGDAPSVSSDAFSLANRATVYYLPGTTGWGTTFGGLPTAPWLLPYPVILTTSQNFGIPTNGFGFTISWATNASVVVEASTNLTNPNWSIVSTNALTGGTSYFSDHQWTNYSARFYRLRSP